MPIIIPDDLPYAPRGIECLRLGARRGGEGIGCCAIDVFQGFTNDPDAECPQQPFFDGDSWSPILDENGTQICVGGPGITNEDVFLAYLAHGSFTNDPEPDHGFIAVLTGDQCQSTIGRAWLKILKREGFRWVGCTSNSVYSEYHPNHIFMLLRATGEYMNGAEIAQLQFPPEEWEALPPPSQNPAERYSKLSISYTQAHTPKEQEKNT